MRACGGHAAAFGVFALKGSVPLPRTPQLLKVPFAVWNSNGVKRAYILERRARENQPPAEATVYKGTKVPGKGVDVTFYVTVTNIWSFVRYHLFLFAFQLSVRVYVTL